MCLVLFFFFFNDTATTEIYTLSLHDALPIFQLRRSSKRSCTCWRRRHNLHGRSTSGDSFCKGRPMDHCCATYVQPSCHRSEEHTSELQSPFNIVCRLLLEKKKDIIKSILLTH